jgi:hypothetical protein
MKTIIKKKQTDPHAIHESLQKGYGIEHPERISGYAAFFMDYGDICVSDNIDRIMVRSPEFRDFVLSSLQDFQNDEYGYISQGDYYDNIEDKWIAGGYEIIGRYALGPFRREGGGKQEMPGCFIKIRYYHGNTYILFDSEFDWLIQEHLSAQNSN